MEELLDYVYKAVRSFNQKNGRDLKVIVKEHPEDISRNNYKNLKKMYRDNKEIIFVKKYDINKLISNSLAVVTINSTVGIESIAKHKPVITLGDAFYNIDGVVYHCDQPNQLDEFILKAVNTNLNINRIKKFIYYIRFHYQLEGSINRTDKQTSANVAARIDSTSIVKEF
jgi:capsule polysaccharide modification protein KpsS